MNLDEIKKGAFPILLIALGVVLLIHFLFPKVVTKIETKVEVREVIRYIVSNSTVTGATSATITPGGTAISGTNLTITNTTSITQTSTTTITEKEVTKYSQSSIIVGGEVTGVFKDYGGFINFKTDIYEAGISYGVLRKDITFRAGVAVLTW